ncbi:hypothetical protein [Methylovulum miyakonense]|uniref:hypothetical protein n=1 Tax=Methylovulum miyakonense TaxID=645578 RepID=UPI00037EF65E|nr:hypothetical protein [Methylovulum miyakonense]
MSATAEQAYKTYFGGNKDWFTDTNKNPARYNIVDDPNPLMIEGSWHNWTPVNNQFTHLFPKKIGRIQTVKVYVGKAKPVSQQQNIGVQFAELASAWKNSVQIISDWNFMILHPSYQRIIGLGPDVIPFILKELEQNGGHWFWALQALTGENPVADEDAGRVRKMTEAWLNWGREKGYI